MIELCDQALLFLHADYYSFQLIKSIRVRRIYWKKIRFQKRFQKRFQSTISETISEYDFRKNSQVLGTPWEFFLKSYSEIVLFFLKSYFSSSISYVHELILWAGRNNRLHEEKEVLDHKDQSIIDLLLTRNSPTNVGLI